MKLPRRVETALKDSANELWLSPISIWELSILVQKKRVVLDAGLDEWINQSRNVLPVKEAPLTWEVALAVRSIRMPHRDPADALIVATAKVFDLTLVTANVHLRSLKGISVLKFLSPRQPQPSPARRSSRRPILPAAAPKPVVPCALRHRATHNL